MIKTFALLSIIAVASATPLLAADFARRPVSPVFVEPSKGFDWTGSYAGVNLGAGRAESLVLNRSGGVATDHTSEVLNALKFNRLRATNAGVLLGGQVGYNYQVTPGSGPVIGFEWDAQYADLRKRRSAASAQSWTDAGDFDRTYTENAVGLSQAGLDFLGTVRGRVGYGFDRVLVYGTAGLAYGTTGYRGAIAETFRWANTSGMGSSGVIVHSAQSHGVQTGSVIGGGVEYALPADSFLNFFGATAVTLKAEYLHFEFGARKIANTTELLGEIKSKPAGNATKSNTSVDTIRAGINYRFGIF